MTNKWALTLAVFINFGLGVSVFIAPDNNQSTYIGSIPGLLILISLAVLFSEVQLIPARFKQEHTWIFFFLELILSLVVLEFFIVKVWTKIEGLMFSMIKFLVGRGNLYEEMGGNGFMSLLVSGISLSFLLYAIGATNSTETIIRNIAETYNKIDGLYMRIKQYSSSQRPSHLNMEPQVMFQACNMEPQAAKCEPAQVYHCIPVCSPVTQPYKRNPQCPVHGDLEINHQVPQTPGRLNKRTN
ncbi:unnamed protein product [Chironomus riparius]|uniref:Uncharacterized protein n=1 Tax=Chironomus riparius TaxID=315576 RepID=A0A9N9RL03_9DIPT|nr:unnamed protein product [Chironomus riparius]